MGWILAAALLLPLGCKDDDPCDPDQDSIGTGCFPKKEPVGGSGGTDSEPIAGAPSEGGGSGVEPPGNPDAMYGTKCTSNEQCGGPAPVCATDPLNYCSQIDCDVGEENEGICPEGWRCFKYQDNPSICVNF